MANAAHPGRADSFKQALLRLETDHDIQPLARMFSESATLDTPAHEQPLIGKSGATEFWTEYLHAFQSVHSQFVHETVLGDTAVLEWRSQGTLPTGRPIEYRGVSILHFNGDLIQSFTAYFDSAAFVTPIAAAAYDVGQGTNCEGGD